ncbi:hypothetical protein BC834DRAFT_969661 [Gloeopeniophorella convolvens]|nr:hypothetical protein BC834DRAFT_969661 [Gloeopeniophorella convolvens]
MPNPYDQLRGLVTVGQDRSMRNRAHGNSSEKMWSTYFTESERFDKDAADGWKEDANGVLVFTGLFSATVAAFVIESYKKLSSDSGDDTVFMLKQISQQLVGNANGTLVIPLTPPVFTPAPSIVCVNAMWLISLVFSIASALSATLMQQWARRYTQLPQIPSLASERARVRSYLFLGIRRYGMLRAAELTPTLLHISVFLFFVGLVIFFFTIFKTVAIILSIFVGLFAVVYLGLTILPCIKHDSPYRTPVSSTWWYMWHTSFSFAATISYGILNVFHDILVPYNTGNITSLRQQVLVRIMRPFELAAKKHRQRLKDGFRKTIVQAAIGASDHIDFRVLTWILETPALSEEQKLQDFIADVPSGMALRLMKSGDRFTKSIFHKHLFALFKTCTPDSFELEEPARTHRLAICLNTIYHVVRAFHDIESGSSPDISGMIREDMRVDFADLTTMKALFTDKDPAIRVIARCICALLARLIPRAHPFDAAQLAWLSGILDVQSNSMYGAASDIRLFDEMNVDAFVHGVLSYQPMDVLPIKQAMSFVETLFVLLDAGSNADFEIKFGGLIRRAERHDRLRHVLVPLGEIFYGLFPVTMPTPSINP